MKAILTLNNSSTYFYKFDGRFKNKFVELVKRSTNNIKSLEVYTPIRIDGKITQLKIIETLI